MPRLLAARTSSGVGGFAHMPIAGAGGIGENVEPALRNARLKNPLGQRRAAVIAEADKQHLRHLNKFSRGNKPASVRGL